MSTLLMSQLFSIRRSCRGPVAIGGLALAIALGACSQPTELGSTPATESDSSAAAPSETPEAAIAQADTAQTDDDLAQIEQTIFEQVNAYREAQGLGLLENNNAIQQQAKAHSQAMAQGEVPVSHEGFDARVEAIAKSVDYRSAAENVAYNEGYNSPGEQAVQGWLESPGHLENIRGDYDLTGIGVAQSGQAYYFTQLFIKTP